MGILSDFIQTGAKSRAGYKRGQRAGEKERYARGAAAAEAEQDRLDSEAQRRHLDRLGKLRDPNDPDVLATKFKYDMAIEKQRGIMDEVRGLRANIQSSDTEIGMLDRDQDRDRKSLKESETPPLLATPGSPEEAQWRRGREALIADTTSRHRTIKAKQDARGQASGSLRSILGLPAERQPPSQYERDGEQVPSAAQTELAKEARMFLKNRPEFEKQGRLKEAHEMYRRRTAAIIAKHRGAR